MKQLLKTAPTAFAFYLLIVLAGCTKSMQAIEPEAVSATETAATESGFRINGSILVDGITRTYTLNLPPGYLLSSNFSLVIALHGGGGSGTQFESSSKLTEKANASGFIVVYPDGTGLVKTWNAGTCCGSAVTNNVNDVKFISQLIDRLVATYKINPKKVYATGHSNGGMLSYRLGCQLSGKIAAIAPNASTLVVTTPCNPARRVPLLHMHSKLDQNVPYTGGYGNGVSGAYMPPLDSVMNVWSSVNACPPSMPLVTVTTGYTLKRWLLCANNTAIHYYLTNDGGHAWPGGLPGGPNSDPPSTAINANDLLWSFFQQYQLP
jgi:polyhydroxybutyrate depolymerase